MLEEYLARIADPGLEERIIEAALRVLDRKGTTGLSIRAVAKAADTTSPTLYDRFRNREELLAAVIRRIHLELVTILSSSKSIEKLVQSYLQFISEYPHRYELVYTAKAKTWETDEPKPVFELILKRMKQQIEQPREELESLALATMALVHGAAMLKIAAGHNVRTSAQLERASIAAVSRILKR